MKAIGMTFNLRNHHANDGENSWPNRVGRVTELIRANQPDFFGVQEAYVEMIQDLMPALGEYVWVGEGRLGGREGESCAIFYRSSRFEEVGHGQFWLSETPEQTGSKSWDSSLPRICTFVRLQERETGQRLDVYNTHLDHVGSEARLLSVKLIHERMASSVRQGIPAILIGDMNCGPNSPPIRFLQEHGFAAANGEDIRLYNVYEKVGEPAPGTFHAFGKIAADSPIDYMFVTPGVEVRSVKVDKQLYDGGYPSDHDPVIAELEW